VKEAGSTVNRSLRTVVVAALVGPFLAATPLAARPLAAQAAYFGGGTSSVEADSVHDAELDALAARIAATLRCPVCRSQSVLESSSQISRQMQALIREKLEAGETPEEITQFFVDSYGDFILLRPPARGLNTLVYVLPAVAFLLGLVVIVWKLRSRRSALETAPAAGAPASQLPEDDGLDPADRAWLDAAIRDDR